VYGVCSMMDVSMCMVVTLLWMCLCAWWLQYDGCVSVYGGYRLWDVSGVYNMMDVSMCMLVTV
jgi:hypothetical protein